MVLTILILIYLSSWKVVFYFVLWIINGTFSFTMQCMERPKFYTSWAKKILNRKSQLLINDWQLKILKSSIHLHFPDAGVCQLWCLPGVRCELCEPVIWAAQQRLAHQWTRYRDRTCLDVTMSYAQWLQIGQLLAILQNIRCSYSKSDT